jgi:hypothetical protein
MQITLKKMFHWEIGCTKRGIILSIQMFFVAMALLDILTMARYHYPDNLSAFIFGLLGIFFYSTLLGNNLIRP